MNKKQFFAIVLISITVFILSSAPKPPSSANVEEKYYNGKTYTVFTTNSGGIFVIRN